MPAADQATPGVINDQQSGGMGQAPEPQCLDMVDLEVREALGMDVADTEVGEALDLDVQDLEVPEAKPRSVSTQSPASVSEEGGWRKGAVGMPGLQLQSDMSPHRCPLCLQENCPHSSRPSRPRASESPGFRSDDSFPFFASSQNDDHDTRSREESRSPRASRDELVSEYIPIDSNDESSPDSPMQEEARDAAGVKRRKRNKDRAETKSSQGSGPRFKVGRRHSDTSI